MTSPSGTIKKERLWGQFALLCLRRGRGALLPAMEKVGRDVVSLPGAAVTTENKAVTAMATRMGDWEIFMLSEESKVDYVGVN